MDEITTFRKIYGNTTENKVLEYLLINQELDIAVGDMAKEIKISKPKAYEIIKEFENKKYIIETRVIGKTQLYKLNTKNKIVKKFIRNFKECLRMIFDEYFAEEMKKEKPVIANVFINDKNVVSCLEEI